MIPPTLAPLVVHLWQSTIFAGVAALLTVALRHNQARVRYWLWLAASCKFLLPFSWLVSVGQRFEWRAAPAVLPPAFSSVTSTIAAPVFLISSPAMKASPDHLPTLLVVICPVWACGFMVVVAGWVREWLRIRSIVRVASPLPLDMPVRVMSTVELIEPGVFGIVRPILLLPEGIATHLTPAQLQGILMHELCHVRRRDNLTATVHMLVQAAFWFYPVVWWLGVRLIDERERACDEHALEAGSEAQVYAESILKVCEFYLRSPLTCMSGVTGSDLKKRLQRIMKLPRVQSLSTPKKLFLATAGLATLAAPITIGVLRVEAQSPTDPSKTPAGERPQFNAASIKPSKSGSQATYVRRQPGGLYTASNAPLRVLVASAYLNEFPPKGELIFGGPAWIDSALFNIEARAEGNPGQVQMNLMAQALLESRFKLVLHHETRQLPIYALVLARPGKIGPQLTQHSSDAKCTDAGPGKPLPQPAPDEAMPAYCGGFFMNPGPGELRETGNRITMDMLGQYLRQSVDRTVVDRTDLTGVYDLTLRFAPAFGPGSQLPTATSASDPSVLPSIFTALQEQLGLKLVSTRGQVDVLVIDHAERPSPN